jgi:hypothetical protein
MHQLHLKVRAVGRAAMRARQHWVMRGMLPLVAGLGVAVAILVAADYGITPAQAATAEGFGAGASSTPAPVFGSPISDGRASSSSANTESADLDAVALSPAMPPQAVGPDPGEGFVRLPGHVLDALRIATVDDTASRSSQSSAARTHKPRLTLTLTLKRDDQAAFDRYLRDVYDENSSNYLKFLSQAEIVKRFGPSRSVYAELSHYLRKSGLRLIQQSRNRLTVTVRGTRTEVERAFHVKIDDYKLGDSAFYANDRDPALPSNLAPRVLAIEGLATLSMPQPAKSKVLYKACGATPGGGNGGNKAVAQCVNFVNALVPLVFDIACTIAPLGILALVALPGGALVATTLAGEAASVAIACGAFSLGNDGANLLKAVSSSTPRIKSALYNTGSSSPSIGSALSDGTGQKIGLLEFDAFNTSDVSDYLSFIGAPASRIDNLSVIPVSGGVASPGAGEGEVLMDIDTAMNMAPGAKIAVYEAPFNGQAASYTAIFNAMINDGVTVISNSWASCEDQVSLAEAQAIDSVLQAAAASGISVFNGAGDEGSTCLDGSANTVSVPADSPNATAVGGTSWPSGQGPGYTYLSETWWDGSSVTPPTGQGGFGVSRYFPRPAYQNGLSTSAMRSIPDVAVRADPQNGIFICQADDGGCPNGTLNGGTSLAAPEWAAFAALLGQAQGKKLGALNPLLYPLAATAGFHSAASMGSDFQHVGLGSPNLNVINRLLNGQSVGIPVAAKSQVLPLMQTGTVQILSNQSLAVPADGVSQGGVLVTLYDANGNTVSGKTVTLTANSPNAVITPASAVSTVSDGAAAFTVTDLTAETLTFTVTDTTDGVVLPTTSLTFGTPSAASGGITANPPSVPADGQTPATIIVTLKDALGRPSPGKTVSIADAGAHAVITGPTPGVTNANGQITFSATDQVNETVTFTAVDVTDNGLAVPGSATVAYNGSTNTACGVGVAPVAATGYTITPYITGLPAASTLFFGNSNIGCPGGEAPTFTSNGTVLVSDFLTGNIYQLGLGGGAVSSSTLLNTLTPALGALVYGKDGSLYATLGNEGGEIVQIDPSTGAQLRVVASNLTCPAGLSVDPLSGDLFFDDQCTGGGTDNASIFRVVDPANTNPNAPTSVVVYATLPTTPNGGMAFAPNGTLYAVSGYVNNTTAPVEQISGTNSATVTVTAVTGVTSDFAVAIGVTNADGSAQSLVAEPAGTLSEIPIATPSAAVVLATGSPGVGVTGPDGCLYSAKYDTIYRLANSSGGCSFAPTSPAPSVSLSPATVSPNPAQGGPATFTATLKNVTTLANVPVTFRVSGVNNEINTIHTNASGTAVLTYVGAQAGSDTIVAAAASGTTNLISNYAQVTWAAGKHVTFLTLNPSPQGGTVNKAVTVMASLSDVSALPAVGITGQTVTFKLGQSTCTAVSTASGIASCQLTPSTPGAATLTATFAGNSQFVAATETIGFSVSAPPTPSPTVTISVSPTRIAAGSPATLTWSSTNATGCTASGSWSGNEATSGTLSVTPAANGSYSYMLTCTGAGGTAAATAVLSATLVAVTVTAKAGGGALSWYVILALGLLVLLRLKGAMGGAGLTGVARARGRGTLIGVAILSAFVLLVAPVNSARADQSAVNQPATALDPFYVGIRVGGMPLREDSGKIDQGLASLGFGDVSATTDISGIAGTLFVGYEFTPHAALELGYTYRDSTTAHLSGTIPSSSKLTPLLQDTAELTRGYGNIISLSYSGRFEVLPRFSLEPRLGGFFWATQVSAVGLDDRIDTTHEGGGVTAGLTAAYRVWRGLELGVSADHFRGFPNNIATLYAGTLVWRFGP